MECKGKASLESICALKGKTVVVFDSVCEWLLKSKHFAFIHCIHRSSIASISMHKILIANPVETMLSIHRSIQLLPPFIFHSILYEKGTNERKNENRSCIANIKVNREMFKESKKKTAFTSYRSGRLFFTSATTTDNPKMEEWVDIKCIQCVSKQMSNFHHWKMIKLSFS